MVPLIVKTTDDAILNIKYCKISTQTDHEQIHNNKTFDQTYFTIYSIYLKSFKELRIYFFF